MKSPMVGDLFALAFSSSLSISQMFERLNARGPWKWLERDSDSRGEYISARPIETPHDGIVNIWSADDVGRYAINVELWSEAPAPQAAFDRVRELVRAQILPAIDARDITLTEDSTIVKPREMIAIPRVRVRIGLTPDEADRLARELTAMEEAYDEPGLSGSRFDRDVSIARRRDTLVVAMPAHDVDVGPFEIATFPVTKREWARFVAETGAKPDDGPQAAPPNSFVTGVSQEEARAFALHHELDLPTEAEWEAAARAGRNFFPWGDSFFPTGEIAYRSPIMEPYIVGSRPETRSASGVHDLVGHFGEYTCDPFEPYPGADRALFDELFLQGRVRGLCAVRGGYDPDQTSTCVSRRGVPPTERRTHLKFRCVRRG